MGVAAVAGEVGEGLGHEGGAQPVPLGDRAHHVLEEGMPVGGDQRRVVLPVHLELAVRVLVVVLVGLPAQRLHGVADLGDHVVAPHQGGLIVAGLLLAVGQRRRSPCRRVISGRIRTRRRFSSRSPCRRPRRSAASARCAGRARPAGRSSRRRPRASRPPASTAGRSGSPHRGSRTDRDRPASCRARSRSPRMPPLPWPCPRSPRPAPAWRAGRPSGR